MVLAKLKWKTCLVDMGDVIMYSNSVEDHIRHFDEIITRLDEASVTFKMKKCTFFRDKIEYLGNLIYHIKTEVDNAHTHHFFKISETSYNEKWNTLLFEVV